MQRDQEESTPVLLPAGSGHSPSPRALLPSQRCSHTPGSWDRAGHPWEPPAAPGLGPGSTSHLQRVTLAQSSTRSHWTGWKLTPNPKQPLKLPAKQAELKPVQDLLIFNQWHLCQFPVQFPRVASGAVVHTLYSLGYCSYRKICTLFSQENPCVFVGVSWKSQHRSSAGVPVSKLALTSHSWGYITCQQPGESVPAASYWCFQRKTPTGLCSQNRNTSQQRHQYPTKDTVLWHCYSDQN